MSRLIRARTYISQKGRHAWLLDHVTAILDAVERPDYREDDPLLGRERVYREDFPESGRWLRVVVDFNSEPAWVVTALDQQTDPRLRRR